MTYAVITACLNAAGTIRRTIRSVLAQNPLPVEYWFVDGGSTDGTPTIVAEEFQTSTVRWQLQPQQGAKGITPAWNQALRQVTADVVFILNADDWYNPDTAARVLGLLAEHPEAGIVAGAIRWATGEDDPAPRLLRPKPLWWDPVLMPLAHPATFIRRAVYAQVGEYDERYTISADYDFVCRCRRAGIRLVITAEPLTNMQVGGLARQRVAVARRETCEVGCRHTWLGVLPRVAYLVRALTGR